MAIKKRYASATEIPPELKALYRQDGTGFVLDLDGGDEDEPEADGDAGRKLAEFRTNNRKMAGELKALQAEAEMLRKRAGVLGDRDPGEVETALDLLGKLKNHEDEALIKAGRIDDVVARRGKAREAEWQKRLEAEATARKQDQEAASKARQIAADMLLERQLRSKLAEKKLRLRQSADEDLMLRARRDWKMPDDLEGDPIPSRDDGSISDLGAWVDKMATEKAHWWEGGDGGGARGGTGTGKMVDGVRVVKRSDLSDIEFGKMAGDISQGKVRVVS